MSIIAENTYHIIPDPTLLLLKVPTTSVAFSVTSTTLLLEVPMAVVTSIVPDLATRVESSVEAAVSRRRVFTAYRRSPWHRWSSRC
jgi:hypothetical protein